MKKYQFLLYLFFLLTIIPLHAQSSIKGIVKDASGELLPGVSVMIKSTSKGTSTDFN
jgi:iron complex outermembrane receptor protein